MKDFIEKAKEFEEFIVRDRRYLHENPEVGFDLVNTVKYVNQQLIEMGYAPVIVGGSGVVALLNPEHPGPTIMLRADMDALPMQEESDLSFASKINAAHTCGHDMHTAMLLGAARIMMKYKNEYNGKVKLVFQPAEELLGGAKMLINEGVMENPKVEASFGMHVNSEETVGYLGYNTAYTHASSDELTITVEGIGCHGAMPEKGIDPINTITHIYNAIQTLNAREIKSGEPAVITFGHLSAGSAMNIIPKSAMMHGSLRAYSTEIRNYIIERIGEITVNIATAFRAKGIFTPGASAPSVKNDADFVQFIVNAYEKMNGIQNKRTVVRTTMGSEDFAFYTRYAPAAFISLGAGLTDKSQIVSLHNPKVLLDEEALHIGSAVHAMIAHNWLEKKNGVI